MTKTILLAILIVGILTTSSVYALSDWRTACGVMNPIDNLECAVDHLEGEINSVFGLVDINIADINQTRINAQAINTTVQQHIQELVRLDLREGRGLDASQLFLISLPNDSDFHNQITLQGGFGGPKMFIVELEPLTILFRDNIPPDFTLQEEYRDWTFNNGSTTQLILVNRTATIDANFQLVGALPVESVLCTFSGGDSVTSCAVELVADSWLTDYDIFFRNVETGPVDTEVDSVQYAVSVLLKERWE